MRMPVNQAEALASPSCSGGAGCGLGSRAQPRRHGGLTPARTERRYRLACRSARSSAERAGPDRFAPAQAVAGPAVRGATPRAPAETPAPPSMVPVSLDAIRLPVKRDLEQLDERLRNVVGQRHPMLMAAADQIFGAGGKKMRPILCFLVARATQACAGNSDINEKQRRLAEITEMIHVASLVHDDVLDECNVRRGAATVNSLFGTRVAVLVGDFLFAQSSWGLAQLENIEVIKLISQVIADFADGEISQAQSLFNCSVTLDNYLAKSFYKTASLIAASCRSAAVFSEVPESVRQAMFDYGKHLGLAFQVVDDILDFTQSAEVLGKPQGQDLASGNLTAPAIFALESDVGGELQRLIETEFEEEGALGRAVQLVTDLGGVAAARRLAREEADRALVALECLPESESKRSMAAMVDWVLERLH